MSNTGLKLKFISRFEDELLGAVFAELLNFITFQDAEGFTREVWAVEVGRDEAVAQL